MLDWALTIFIVALSAAVFGFGGIASVPAGLAQVLFVAFAAMALFALPVRESRGEVPR